MPGLKGPKREEQLAAVLPWQWFDWCGPYISDGKFQSSRPGFTTARSAQEQRCKEHDIAYYYCKSQKCFEEADRRFAQDSWGTSFLGSAQSVLVNWGGKYFHGEYSEDKKRKAPSSSPSSRKRLRGSASAAPVKSVSQSNSRSNVDVPVAPDPRNPLGPTHAMSLPGPGGNNGTQGEIGIKPFGKVADTQPDYFTSKFKWVYDTNIEVNNGTLFKNEFRINSPFDPSIDVTSAADTRRNAAVNGWGIYAERYKFYRVIGVRVHVSFHFPKGVYIANLPNNYTVRAIKTDVLNAYTKACGVNINPGRIMPFSAGSVSTWQQLAQNRYSNFRIIEGETTRADFEINYTPDAWATPVMEQQREQFWTPIAQNPQLPDTYTVWAQALARDSQMAIDTNEDGGGVTGGVFPLLNGHMVVMQEFTVQFREWSTDMIERSLFPDRHSTVDEGLPQQSTFRTSETMSI